MTRFSKLIFALVFTAFMINPSWCLAEKMYKIEALQVVKIDPYELGYKTFIEELKKNGIVEGKNLKINRTIIDFDVEKAGLWTKVGVLMRIKKAASKIVDEKPDLVLTIGTTATKYAKEKIVSAGIPLVFTDVASPLAAGCESLTKAGPGFTGGTLYFDLKEAMKIIKLSFPKISTYGMIISDEDNAIDQVEQAKKAGPAMGIKVISKMVGKSDSILPAAQELFAQGAQGFIMPLDTYYGVRNYEPCNQLAKFTLDKKIPMVSVVYHRYPGFVLYVGADFGTIGTYSGDQAVKILKEGVKPEALPIQRQKELTIMVDAKRMKTLGVTLPNDILMLVKTVD